MTVPDATICTPTIARINVDFPHPLGPSKPVTVPEPTSSVNPSSTGCPPRTTVTPDTTIAGSVRRSFTKPTIAVLGVEQDSVARAQSLFSNDVVSRVQDCVRASRCSCVRLPDMISAMTIVGVAVAF